MSTFLLTSLGQPGDVGVAAITIGAVMVIAALGPHHAWHAPLIGVVGTAVGIGIGLAASWLVSGKLVDGLRHKISATGATGLRKARATDC